MAKKPNSKTTSENTKRMATFEVIVGKQGTQKFPIKNAGVSRQHARIIIDDRGQWVLEDLNSTNGTFVRDEKGEYQHVSRIGIQEDTVIRLGDESNNGYSFMAHHVVEDDPDNYAYEFARIRQWREDFRKERDRCQSQTRNKGLIQIFLSVAIIGITFIPAIEQRIQMMILRIGMLLPPLYNFFVQGKNKMQKIYERQQRFLVCPRCGRPLTDYEISKEICMSCKAHS